MKNIKELDMEALEQVTGGSEAFERSALRASALIPRSGRNLVDFGGPLDLCAASAL